MKSLPLPDGAPKDPDGVGLPVTGEAGTVILIHFDLWHRAFPNHTDRERFMFKFQFTRLDEPTEPTWSKKESEIPLGELSEHPNAPIWREMWRWLAAEPEKFSPGDASALGEELESGSEEVRLPVAYALGGLGDAGRAILKAGLHSERDEVRRASAYGLSAAGASAVGDLVGALKSESDRTRGYAVFALGDLGAKAESAVPALAALAQDPSEFVRRPLADALGQIRSQPSVSVPALTKLLQDADDQTRFNAAYGLAKFREDATAAIPALVNALEDSNRYVRGHATIALEQIGTPDALKALLKHYQTTRWCPLTTKESSF